MEDNNDELENIIKPVGNVLYIIAGELASSLSGDDEQVLMLFPIILNSLSLGYVLGTIK